MLNICGCLVHVMPNKTDDVLLAIESMDGCETHAHEDGRLVVTTEDTDDKSASDLIMDLHQIPGILTVTLSYHHFEPLGPQEAAASAL